MRRATGAQNRAAPSLSLERATRRPAIFRTSEVLVSRQICREKFLNCWIAGATRATYENAWRQAMTQAPSEDLA